jgi:hypothetical protein
MMELAGSITTNTRDIFICLEQTRFSVIGYLELGKFTHLLG